MKIVFKHFDTAHSCREAQHTDARLGPNKCALDIGGENVSLLVIYI